MSLNPLSPCLVALSDTYHQYNPLFIVDIQSLVVLNGFDCIVTRSSSSNAIHLLPVSKCEIVGIVRYCQVKSNGSVSLIIDDGSGMIDAIFWSDMHTLNENEPFTIGEAIRIRGNINVLSLHAKQIIHLDGKIYEGREGVREVYISSFQQVFDANEEISHWAMCLLFRKRLQNSIDGKNGFNCSKLSETATCITNPMLIVPVLNGLETYHLLPAVVKDQLSLDESNLNIYECRDWFVVKYYGRGCKCNHLYKDKLLYCHCLASKDDNDPDFMFRDAVLNTLLHLENILKLDESSSSVNKYGTVASEIINKSMNVPSCLKFEFSHLLRNQSLQLVANKVLETSKISNTSIHRLFSSTFRCLRKDGVVYLQDQNNDTYLLLSADSVLIPTVKNQLISEEQLDFELGMSSLATNSQSFSKLPNYMESLPYKKLQLIRRLAGIERKKMATSSEI